MENFDLSALMSGSNDSVKAAVEKAVEVMTAYGLDVIGAIIILFLGWMAASWVKKILLKAMRRAKMDETLARFLSSMARYGVLAFTLVAVLSQFGIQTTSLIAVMGAAGLAIGLAMQGTLSHVAAGVMLLIFRPFKIGDYIDGGGESGTIEEIGLFTTTMNTPQNVRIIIPNSQLWDTSLKNYSSNRQRRLDLTVGIGYGDDINKAFKTILAVVKKDKRALSSPAAPMVAVNGLGESSVDMTIRVWCDREDYWAMKFDLTKAIKEALDKAGISIPFPQRDMHIVYDVKAEKAAGKSKKAA
jgi:small conductance mechanosensitive channel